MYIITNDIFCDKKIKKECKIVSATICYGVGCITMKAKMFCDTFGLRCKLYEKKVDLAKTTAINYNDYRIFA